MNELINSHTSLLNFISNLADDFSAEAINLDAMADNIDLPGGDLVGLQGFSFVSGSDHRPLPVVSGMLVLMTENDPNNTRLIQRLNTVFNRLSPQQMLPYLDAETGDVLADLKVVGQTRVMPSAFVQQRATQGITFQLAIQAAQ